MASQLENGSNIDPNSIEVETAMASHHENRSTTDSIGAETHESDAEKFGTMGCAVPIEDVVEKINLLDSSLSIENGDSDGSDSESENSESESPSGSGSGSSSSSSSDSEDDNDGDMDIEDDEISGSNEEKMFSWSVVADDEDGDDSAGAGPIRSMNELQNLPPVPPVNATLESHHQMLPVVIVTSVLGAQVIVEGAEKHDPLNEGSILWLTKSRKPLGLVDEIFGPVKNPYYVVRYNSESEVPAGIHEGTLISFVPEFADHVLNNKDLYKKGYDASGANDEELSDAMEFSDDEKEAEYKRKRSMTKRGANDQNHGKKKNNRKKIPPKEHVAPTMPDAPAASLLDNGNCPPFSSNEQGYFPSFTHLNTAPNFATNGVWTNGTFSQQPPSGMLSNNGFPTNGMSWYPQSTQFSPQLPMPTIPFQQQLLPNPGSLPATMLPGMQPNIFAQTLCAAGLLGLNQMAFGMGPSFPQIQPPISAAQQGFPSIEFQSERNLNLHSNNISGAPPQFHPRTSAN